MKTCLILGVMFAVQGLIFYAVSHRTEVIPKTRPLAEFPRALGDWRMAKEDAIEQDERDVLRADDYLARDYAGPRGERASLFVAYFRSQRAGQTPHSPKNCLPGSGWTWSVADTIAVNAIEINRYLVSKGEQRAVVLYWYQSGDRVVASEYRAALFTAWDALRYNRTDTELVRIVSRDTDGAVRFVREFYNQER